MIQYVFWVVKEIERFLVNNQLDGQGSKMEKLKYILKLKRGVSFDGLIKNRKNKIK